MAYQQITLTLIIDEDDAASVKRELEQTLEFLSEEYQIHQDRVEDEPVDYDLMDDEYVERDDED